MAKIGQKLELICMMSYLTANGHWSWSYEQGPLPRNTEVVTLKRTLSTLRIHKLDKSHFGEYTCEYEDRTNYYSFYDTVHVTKKPQPESTQESQLKGSYSKFSHH